MCFLFRNEVTTFAESVHILLLTGKKTDKFRKCEIYIVYTPKKEVTVPRLKPGCEGEITVELVAPQKPGTV
jgi:hypothetical protein